MNLLPSSDDDDIKYLTTSGFDVISSRSDSDSIYSDAHSSDLSDYNDFDTFSDLDDEVDEGLSALRRLTQHSQSADNKRIMKSVSILGKNGLDYWKLDQFSSVLQSTQHFQSAFHIDPITKPSQLIENIPNPYTSSIDEKARGLRRNHRARTSSDFTPGGPEDPSSDAYQPIPISVTALSPFRDTVYLQQQMINLQVIDREFIQLERIASEFEELLPLLDIDNTDTGEIIDQNSEKGVKKGKTKQVKNVMTIDKIELFRGYTPESFRKEFTLRWTFLSQRKLQILQTISPHNTLLYQQNPIELMQINTNTVVKQHLQAYYTGIVLRSHIDMYKATKLSFWDDKLQKIKIFSSFNQNNINNSNCLTYNHILALLQYSSRQYQFINLLYPQLKSNIENYYNNKDGNISSLQSNHTFLLKNQPTTPPTKQIALLDTIFSPQSLSNNMIPTDEFCHAFLFFHHNAPIFLTIASITPLMSQYFGQLLRNYVISQRITNELLKHEQKTQIRDNNNNNQESEQYLNDLYQKQQQIHQFTTKCSIHDLLSRYQYIYTFLSLFIPNYLHNCRNLLHFAVPCFDDGAIGKISNNINSLEAISTDAGADILFYPTQIEENHVLFHNLSDLFSFHSDQYKPLTTLYPHNPKNHQKSGKNHNLFKNDQNSIKTEKYLTTYSDYVPLAPYNNSILTQMHQILPCQVLLSTSSAYFDQFHEEIHIKRNISSVYTADPQSPLFYRIDEPIDSMTDNIAQPPLHQHLFTLYKTYLSHTIALPSHLSFDLGSFKLENQILQGKYSSPYHFLTFSQFVLYSTLQLYMIFSQLLNTYRKNQENLGMGNNLNKSTNLQKITPNIENTGGFVVIDDNFDPNSLTSQPHIDINLKIRESHVLFYQQNIHKRSRIDQNCPTSTELDENYENIRLIPFFDHHNNVIHIISSDLISPSASLYTVIPVILHHLVQSTKLITVPLQSHLPSIQLIDLHSVLLHNLHVFSTIIPDSITPQFNNNLDKNNNNITEKVNKPIIIPISNLHNPIYSSKIADSLIKLYNLHIYHQFPSLQAFTGIKMVNYTQQQQLHPNIQHLFHISTTSPNFTQMCDVSSFFSHTYHFALQLCANASNIPTSWLLQFLWKNRRKWHLENKLKHLLCHYGCYGVLDYLLGVHKHLKNGSNNENIEGYMKFDGLKMSDIFSTLQRYEKKDFSSSKIKQQLFENTVKNHEKMAQLRNVIGNVSYDCTDYTNTEYHGVHDITDFGHSIDKRPQFIKTPKNIAISNESNGKNNVLDPSTIDLSLALTKPFVTGTRGNTSSFLYQIRENQQKKEQKRYYFGNYKCTNIYQFLNRIFYSEFGVYLYPPQYVLLSLVPYSQFSSVFDGILTDFFPEKSSQQLSSSSSLNSSNNNNNNNIPIYLQLMDTLFISQIPIDIEDEGKNEEIVQHTQFYNDNVSQKSSNYDDNTQTRTKNILISPTPVMLNHNISIEQLLFIIQSWSMSWQTQNSLYNIVEVMSQQINLNIATHGTTATAYEDMISTTLFQHSPGANITTNTPSIPLPSKSAFVSATRRDYLMTVFQQLSAIYIPPPHVVSNYSKKIPSLTSITPKNSKKLLPLSSSAAASAYDQNADILSQTTSIVETPLTLLITPILSNILPLHTPCIIMSGGQCVLNTNSITDPHSVLSVLPEVLHIAAKCYSSLYSIVPPRNTFQNHQNNVENDYVVNTHFLSNQPQLVYICQDQTQSNRIGGINTSTLAYKNKSTNTNDHPQSHTHATFSIQVSLPVEAYAKYSIRSPQYIPNEMISSYISLNIHKTDEISLSHILQRTIDNVPFPQLSLPMYWNGVLKHRNSTENGGLLEVKRTLLSQIIYPPPNLLRIVGESSEKSLKMLKITENTPQETLQRYIMSVLNINMSSCVKTYHELHQKVKECNKSRQFIGVGGTRENFPKIVQFYHNLSELQLTMKLLALIKSKNTLITTQLTQYNGDTTTTSPVMYKCTSNACGMQQYFHSFSQSLAQLKHIIHDIHLSYNDSLHTCHCFPDLSPSLYHSCENVTKIGDNQLDVNHKEQLNNEQLVQLMGNPYYLQFYALPSQLYAVLSSLSPQQHTTIHQSSNISHIMNVIKLQHKQYQYQHSMEKLRKTTSTPPVPNTTQTNTKHAKNNKNVQSHSHNDHSMMMTDEIIRSQINEQNDMNGQKYQNNHTSPYIEQQQVPNGFSTQFITPCTQYALIQSIYRIDLYYSSLDILHMIYGIVGVSNLDHSGTPVSEKSYPMESPENEQYLAVKMANKTYKFSVLQNILSSVTPTAPNTTNILTNKQNKQIFKEDDESHNFMGDGRLKAHQQDLSDTRFALPSVQYLLNDYNYSPVLDTNLNLTLFTPKTDVSQKHKMKLNLSLQKNVQGDPHTINLIKTQYPLTLAYFKLLTHVHSLNLRQINDILVLLLQFSSTIAFPTQLLLFNQKSHNLGETKPVLAQQSVMSQPLTHNFPTFLQSLLLTMYHQLISIMMLPSQAQATQHYMDGTSVNQPNNDDSQRRKKLLSKNAVKNTYETSLQQNLRIHCRELTIERLLLISTTLQRQLQHCLYTTLVFLYDYAFAPPQHLPLGDVICDHILHKALIFHHFTKKMALTPYPHIKKQVALSHSYKPINHNDNNVIESYLRMPYENLEIPSSIFTKPVIEPTVTSLISSLQSYSFYISRKQTGTISAAAPNAHTMNLPKLSLYIQYLLKNENNEYLQNDQNSSQNEIQVLPTAKKKLRKPLKIAVQPLAPVHIDATIKKPKNTLTSQSASTWSIVDPTAPSSRGTIVPQLLYENYVETTLNTQLLPSLLLSIARAKLKKMQAQYGIRKDTTTNSSQLNAMHTNMLVFLNTPDIVDKLLHKLFFNFCSSHNGATIHVPQPVQHFPSAAFPAATTSAGINLFAQQQLIQTLHVLSHTTEDVDDQTPDCVILYRLINNFQTSCKVNELYIVFVQSIYNVQVKLATNKRNTGLDDWDDDNTDSTDSDREIDDHRSTKHRASSTTLTITDHRYLASHLQNNENIKRFQSAINILSMCNVIGIKGNMISKKFYGY